MLNKETSKYVIDLNDFKSVSINPSFDLIKEDIISNNEGVVGLNGALMVDTGIFTGRSPNDKYFVEEDYSKKNLWWGPVNKKIDKNIFDTLYNKVVNYYKNDIQYQVSGSHQLFNLAMNNIRASGGNIPPMTRGTFMDFKGKLVD